MTANEPRTTSVEPADRENAEVAASAPVAVDVATAASASAASGPTPREAPTAGGVDLCSAHSSSHSSWSPSAPSSWMRTT